MNHTTGRVAIISKRLWERPQDVEAVAGLRACRPGPMPQGVSAVATTGEDPLFDRASAFAGAKKLSLITIWPAPIRLSALDRAGRPLGYAVDGLAPAPRPPEDRVLVDAAVAGLIAASPPGELRLAADFHPDDPRLVWLDPYDRRRISLARALEIAGDILRHRAKTARRSFVVGVTRWKRPAVRAFLDGPNGPPVFLRDPDKAASRARAGRGRMVMWASRDAAAAERAAQRAGAPLARLEDGFLRSVGLGAAFIEALSLVLDDTGIYYDPSAPSDLETLLRDAEISPELAARAAALRRRLVAENVTKYNVGVDAARVVPEGRTGVLVPGQVEDDASILRGAGAVRTNRDLLAAVRRRRPDAFIVYKPHPDVVAGYRRGAAPPQDLALADAVVVEGSIAALYPQCSALETMTSLSGFEALLRGLSVTTHGAPFYAGWGLTEDLAPHPRRGVSRTLDELVAATLVLYPLYRDTVSGLPCGPETALDRLLAARARAMTWRGAAAARLRHAYALTRHRMLGPIARRLP